MKKSIKYLITMLSGALGVYLIISSKDLFAQTELVKIFHILCDAFFSVGVIMTGFGLLIFTCNEGIFDGLVYGVSSFFSMFRRNHERKYHTYYDYKESKADRNLSFGYMVLCGLFYLTVGIVMYILYTQYR